MIQKRWQQIQHFLPCDANWLNWYKMITLAGCRTFGEINGSGGIRWTWWQWWNWNLKSWKGLMKRMNSCKFCEIGDVWRHWSNWLNLVNFMVSGEFDEIRRNWGHVLGIIVSTKWPPICTMPCTTTELKNCTTTQITNRIKVHPCRQISSRPAKVIAFQPNRRFWLELWSSTKSANFTQFTKIQQFHRVRPFIHLTKFD